MRSRGARFYAMDKIAFLQALILDSGNRLALLERLLSFRAMPVILRSMGD
jgi:hypothetical protein